MKSNPSRPSPPILHPLLPYLWLHEPDAGSIAEAVRALGLPPAEPSELAAAYADTFLLNVPPYGALFTDDFGELNGPEAQRAAQVFKASGYRPPELSEVGAPDHLGLWLGWLTHGHGSGGEAANLIADLLAWAPVCCLSVGREPGVHRFYGALAAATREVLLADRRWQAVVGHPSFAVSPGLSDDDEVSLRDIVCFFLAPARCGVYLSRSRLGHLAKTMGLRLPFGSRFEVAEALFTSAGEAQQLEPLLGGLTAEVETWASEYQAWAIQFPAWRPSADVWLGRTAQAVRTLAGMHTVAEAGRA